MQETKNDLARYIATILFGGTPRQSLLAADHFQVKALERQHTKAELLDLRDKAVAAEYSVQ